MFLTCVEFFGKKRYCLKLFRQPDSRTRECLYIIFFIVVYPLTRQAAEQAHTGDVPRVFPAQEPHLLPQPALPAAAERRPGALQLLGAPVQVTAHRGQNQVRDGPL